MYTITHNGRPLRSKQGPHLAQPILHMEANRLTTLEFTIYPDNPEYTKIQMRKSEIRVYRDGVLMIPFRPIRKKNAFGGGVTYTCEEWAACLNDCLIRPIVLNLPDEGAADAAYDFITYILAELSFDTTVFSAVPQVGDVDISTGETIHYVNNEYIGGWESLQSGLASIYGGYIIPRYEVDLYDKLILHIDYRNDAHLPVCSQAIEFGKNMTDMFIDSDSSDMFNVLIPLGADSKTIIDETEDGQPIYSPLTIKSVNDGNDYLEDTTSVSLYGRREKIQKWDDIDSPAKLKRIGQEYLNASNTSLKKSITLSAADLHILNADISAFSCLQRVRVKSPLYDIDEEYTITALELPLGEPKLLSITLGDTKDFMTDRLTQSKSSSRKSSQSSTSTSRADKAASADTQVRHDKSIIRNQRDIALLDKRVSLVVDTTPAIKAADIVAAISGTPDLSLVVTGNLTVDNDATVGGNLSVSNVVTCRKVDCGQIEVDGARYVAMSNTIVESVNSRQHNFVYDDGNGNTGTVSGCIITGTQEQIIYYLGMRNGE